MTIRRIKGASGDLYDPKSKAHRLALNQLAKVLRDIGFVVECHKDETTLRVYPTKRHQYPLLNPGFWREVTEFSHLTLHLRSLQRGRRKAAGIKEPREFLMVVVSSQGDGSNRGTMPCARDSLDGYLETLTCRRYRDLALFYFHTGAGSKKNYYRHGALYLPLHFTKADKIDFEALGKPLRSLLEFLDEEKIKANVVRRDISGHGCWVTPAPASQAHLERISGGFETRGRHFVYGRSDYFGGGRTLHMEIWKACDGRLLMRCWPGGSAACREYVDEQSFEITGVDASAIPARDERHSLSDWWIPKDVREAYDEWVLESF